MFIDSINIYIMSKIESVQTFGRKVCVINVNVVVIIINFIIFINMNSVMND